MIKLEEPVLSANPQTHKELSGAVVIIPTYNAGQHMLRMRTALADQGVDPAQVLIIDSSSTDGTRELARQAGFRVQTIPKLEFRHGGTRQRAVEMVPEAEILVFLTQDAIPVGDCSLLNLVKALDDPQVGAAYGRQLARPEAGMLERHAREYNYPATSVVRSYEDRVRLGFRATYFSNSFAAYRQTALREVNGFPEDAIVSEEVTVVARMLMAGWKSAYCADATVIHSHRFTMRAILARYFDIGVHHARSPWLLEAFGNVGGEGKKFLLSELRCLARQKPSECPHFLGQTIGKFVGYRLGLNERKLPLWLKKRLTGQTSFWNGE